jgi:hypothetical protein
MPHTCANTDVVVRELLTTQAKEAKLGRLTVWTVYDRPTDWPDSIVARRHIVTKQGPRPTDDMLFADLGYLRDCFHDAGLVCIPRHPNDDEKIVETWV